MHGGLDKPGEVSQVVYGQENINKKIMSLNFKDCHAKILQVDSMETIGKGVVIQVTGELSNDGQPMRKFLQTFVLAPQSLTKYYAKNDIFRYQDEIFLDDDDYSVAEKSTDIGSDKTDVPPLKSIDKEEKEIRETPQSMTNVSNEYYENSNGSVHEIISSNVEKLSVNEVSEEKAADLTTNDNFENEAYLKTEDYGDRNSTSPQPQANETKTYANMVSKNPNANFPPFSGMTTFTTATKAETTSVSAPFVRPTETSPIPAVIPNNQTAPPVANKPPSNNISGPPKENRERLRRDRPPFTRRNDSREMTPGRANTNDSDEDFRDKKQYPDENQVFVGNLPQHIVEENLRGLFARYGNILDVRINRQNQKMGSNVKTPNYGFVTFENPEVVQQILKQKVCNLMVGSSLLTHCSLSLQPIYFDNHRFNVEEKRSQAGRGGGPSFRESRGGNMSGNRSQTGGPSGRDRDRDRDQRNRNNQFSGNMGSRGQGGGGGSGSGGGGGFGGNRNSSNRQNR